jgi:hypothetical protein
MDELKRYFNETYLESRAAFRALIEPVQRCWPQAVEESYALPATDEDLTIDMIKALPPSGGKRLLILSCGLHGIEGYIGSAMLQLFTNEYLEKINSAETALIMVHSINPWGMKHRRRVNENNVDLNRNFIYKLDGSRAEVNPAYDSIDSFVNPSTPVKAAATPLFYLQLGYIIATLGPSRFRENFLLGQYRFPQGLYFGGHDFEYSAGVMKDLFDHAAADFDDLLLIDMHSGYGPRHQMTIVNSRYEQRASVDLQEIFSYPLIAKTDPQEFYQMQGDMVDYYYQLIYDRYPGKRFFATSFEFGTYGDSLGAVLRSYRTMVNENRFYHHGAKSEHVAGRVKRDFDNLFIPREIEWRKKALQDARQAFNGILQAEGYSV